MQHGKGQNMRDQARVDETQTLTKCVRDRGAEINARTDIIVE